MTAMVRPPAMIIASEAWLSTLVKLVTVGKARGDRIEKTMTMSTRPIIVPYRANTPSAALVFGDRRRVV
jgi:hypothetical protein